jgi:putative ABC transport system substrate-binding protein
MKRREFITALGGAAAWPLAARAQQPAMPVIGFLHPGFPESGSPVFDALREGLREVGYVQGETVKVEARWARGKPEILPQLTQELIQLHAAILIPTARASIEAARAATTDLPIVATDLESDPVVSGYVASLARPGGNLTGIFLDAPSLCGKNPATCRSRSRPSSN